MKKNLITSALALVLASTSISSFANTDISESYIIKFNDEFKGKTHIPKGLLKQVYSGKFKKTFKSAFSGVVLDLTEKQVKNFQDCHLLMLLKKIALAHLMQ